LGCVQIKVEEEERWYKGGVLGQVKACWGLHFVKIQS
jgi:hypothetical protein